MHQFDLTECDVVKSDVFESNVFKIFTKDGVDDDVIMKESFLGVILLQLQALQVFRKPDGETVIT